MPLKLRLLTPRTALTLVLLFGSPFACAAPSAREWTYQYLLATSMTERELAPITEHIIKDKSLQRSELLDFSAEVLLARMSDSNYPLQNKLRLIRVLGTEKSPRYTDLLNRVLDQSKSKVVQKEARSALKKKGTAATYVPGSIDVREIVAEVDSLAAAAKPTTAQGEHLAKFAGGTFEQLFEWAGRPHQIVSGQTRVSDGIFIHIKIQRIAFFYRGVGRVVYGYVAGKRAWEFQAVVTDPMAFEQEFAYRDRARELGLPDGPTLEMMQLVSGYTASIKSVVEKNYQRETRPLEFMDTAAEILATQAATAKDPVTVDMHAWICRLLTQHGGQRYAAILARVARETDDSKLRRFAILPIEKTHEVPAEPYIVGTTSLSAQRGKYPSLYPESTFQSGRL